MSIRIAVIGTGAVGGFYGGRLAHAGHDVHFLGRSDIAVLRTQGLQVRSPLGDFHLRHVQAFDDPAAIGPCDVVLITLKSTGNDALEKWLPPLMGPDTAVLLMQNGLGGEDLVARIVGARRVLGCLAFVCINRLAPGVIHHLDYGDVAVGEFARAGISVRLERMCALLRDAFPTVDAVADLVESRWRKLIWNITFNGLSVLLDARTDDIMRDPAARSLAEAVMHEVFGMAKANGVTLPDAWIPDRLAHTAKMKPYLTSMKLDYDAGRVMELDAIFAEPLRRATAAGFDAPRVRMVHQALQFLQARKALGRAAPALGASATVA